MRPWKKRLREPAPASELPPLDVTVAHTPYGALVVIAGAGSRSRFFQGRMCRP